MAKFNIYQVLPRLWGEGKFSDWTQAEFDYLKWMGISHVWYTGVMGRQGGSPLSRSARHLPLNAGEKKRADCRPRFLIYYIFSRF